MGSYAAPRTSGEPMSESDEIPLRVTRLEHEMREGFTTVHLGMAQITAILTTELNKPDES